MVGARQMRTFKVCAGVGVERMDVGREGREGSREDRYRVADISVMLRQAAGRGHRYEKFTESLSSPPHVAHLLLLHQASRSLLSALELYTHSFPISPGMRGIPRSDAKAF